MASSTFEERLLPVLIEELALRPRAAERKVRLGARSFAALAAAAVLIGAMVFLTGGSSERIINITVVSSSMLPSYSVGDTVAVDTVAFDSASPQRGDVIAFRTADDPENIFIKRVIGLPGDIVEKDDGVISVNGEVLDEPYARLDNRSGSWTVEADHVFVLGDNRPVSNDSSIDGPGGMGQIPIQDIVGLVTGSVSGPPDIPPGEAPTVTLPAVP